MTKSLASLADVMVLCVGMKMLCFESQSTMTRMVSKPEDGGSFLMKSIEMESGSFWDWKLLQESIGSVMLFLGSHTGGAGLAAVLNKGAEEQPSVVITDELKGLVLAEVSGDQMVVFVEKNV